MLKISPFFFYDFENGENTAATSFSCFHHLGLNSPECQLDAVLGLQTSSSVVSLPGSREPTEKARPPGNPASGSPRPSPTAGDSPVRLFWKMQRGQHDTQGHGKAHQCCETDDVFRWSRAPARERGQHTLQCAEPPVRRAAADSKALRPTVWPRGRRARNACCFHSAGPPEPWEGLVRGRRRESHPRTLQWPRPGGLSCSGRSPELGPRCAQHSR